MSRLPEYTVHEKVLLSLRGLPGMKLKGYEEQLVKDLDRRGVSRDEALPLIKELLAKNLAWRKHPAELTGDAVQWGLTEDGARLKEALYDRRLDLALGLLGPLEMRHEQVLRAIERQRHSSVVTDAWKELGLGWDFVATANELASVGLLKEDYGLRSLNQYGEGNSVQLATIGYKLMLRMGWTPAADARKAEWEAAAEANSQLV